MKTFKTISEFKRILEIGDKLRIFRRGHDLGKLEVSVTRSTCFAVDLPREGGWISKAWLTYPKSKDCEIENNILIIPDGWVMKGDERRPEKPKLIIKFAENK